MKGNWFRFFAIVLVVAALASMSLSAATLTARRGGSAAAVVTFAREVDGPYTMPTGILTAEYVPAVIRAANKDFFVKFALLDGAKFAAGSAEPSLEYAGPGGSVTINRLTTLPLTDKTFYEWHVIVNAAATSYPTYVVHFDDLGLGVRIDAGTTVENGGSVRAEVTVRDAATGEPFDTPAQDVLFQGDWAIFMDPNVPNGITPDDGIIDVASDRKHFVDEPTAFGLGPADDDTDREAGARSNILWNPSFFAADGSIFCLSEGATTDKMFANMNTQKLKLTFASNLSEITKIYLNEGSAYEFSHTLTDAERASASLSVEGTWYQFYDGSTFQIYIQDDGDRIESRDLTLSIELLPGGVVQNGRVLVSNVLLTRWRPNGTILTMPWTNGNNSVMNGRVYLYNQSAVTGSITARVVTMPRVGTPSAELGSVVVGNLPANGTAMIKVAEDVLAPLPTVLPYITDGGNLMIEFTIQVTNASGIFQVFNSDFAYGTTPLKRVN